MGMPIEAEREMEKHQSKQRECCQLDPGEAPFGAVAHKYGSARRTTRANEGRRAMRMILPGQDLTSAARKENLRLRSLYHGHSVGADAVCEAASRIEKSVSTQRAMEEWESACGD